MVAALWRQKLTHEIHRQYFERRLAYTMLSIDKRIDNTGIPSFFLIISMTSVPMDWM
jgi:ABC-type uncharacterized transport system fused permease/ATPase subunit